jgi:hypothetical protein
MVDELTSKRDNRKSELLVDGRKPTEMNWIQKWHRIFQAGR